MKPGANRRSGAAERPAQVRWLRGRMLAVARFREAEAVEPLGRVKERK